MAKLVLPQRFFNRNPLVVAKALLGKVLWVRCQDTWLKAQITETEAYYLSDKASHASLGYTEKRKALFMPAGTIYMYYSRGGDSLNISCRGAGNAVLIKSGVPYLSGRNSKRMVQIMQFLNPEKNRKELRSIKKLCAGQALLCRALNLKVPDWDQQQFDRKRFFIANGGQKPKSKEIIRTTRRGIPKGRDEHLPYRFVWRL